MYLIFFHKVTLFITFYWFNTDNSIGSRRKDFETKQTRLDLNNEPNG